MLCAGAIEEIEGCRIGTIVYIYHGYQFYNNFLPFDLAASALELILSGTQVKIDVTLDLHFDLPDLKRANLELGFQVYLGIKGHVSGIAGDRRDSVRRESHIGLADLPVDVGGVPVTLVKIRHGPSGNIVPICLHEDADIRVVEPHMFVGVARCYVVSDVGVVRRRQAEGSGVVEMDILHIELGSFGSDNEPEYQDSNT